MKKKPDLLVLAAGMGSRYGGLKQLDPVGGHGQLIIDYSLYDAKRAGFERVVFVIRPEMEPAFRETIQARVGSAMEICYAHQRQDDLPQGFTYPQGRTKPWGTAHAVLAARNLIDGAFATINADDFYGADGYQKVYQFLAEHEDSPQHYNYGLVGYRLENTVTEHGSVARGVCQLDEHNRLLKIDERTCIEKGIACPRYSTDQGTTWVDLPKDTIVSMNLWGFTQSYLIEAEIAFQNFLQTMEDPLKNEYYLPVVADLLVKQKKAQVSVVQSQDKWYGITYPEDRATVVEAISAMTQAGLYPENLWE